MKKDLTKHFIDFAFLLVILGVCLFGLYYFSHQVAKQIVIAVLLGLSYIFWGIFHHWHLGNLKSKIIFEYLSMASLVVFVLILLLLRV